MKCNKMMLLWFEHMSSGKCTCIPIMSGTKKKSYLDRMKAKGYRLTTVWEG